VMVLLLAVPSAHAQLSGSNISGDFGLKSGSQAPPGIYLGYFLYGYDSSKIVGQDGRELSLSPTANFKSGPMPRYFRW
jgi:hypothetical protein